MILELGGDPKEAFPLVGKVVVGRGMLGVLTDSRRDMAQHLQAILAAELQDLKRDRDCPAFLRSPLICLPSFTLMRASKRPCRASVSIAPLNHLSVALAAFFTTLFAELRVTL